MALTKTFFLLLNAEADFILVNGGEAGNQRTKSSSLIALDASAASASICSPPGDMIDHRYGHMVAKSGGVLTVCGGSDVAKCEVFDKEQRTWTYTAEGLHQGKGWFPYVSLDDNRIWIGRKWACIAISFTVHIFLVWHVLNHIKF